MPNHAVCYFQSNQKARFVYIPKAKEGNFSKLSTQGLEMTNGLLFLLFLASLSCLQVYISTLPRGVSRRGNTPQTGNVYSAVGILFGFTLKSVNQAGH